MAETKRRKPRQARSQATHAAIVEAAAHILERSGRDGLTTNVVARRAGVSIGSLYQYFPDRDAIVLALARRDLAKTQAAVLAAIAAAPAETRPARAVIRALIDTFGARPRLRRHLLEALYAQGLHAELNAPLDLIARRIALRAVAVAPRTDPARGPIRLFVLTRAVTGVIRAALLEDFPGLGTPEFEDELVALIEGYTAPIRG